MSQKASKPALHQAIELIYSLNSHELLTLQLVLNQQIHHAHNQDGAKNEDEMCDEVRGHIEKYVQGRVESLRGPQLALLASYYLVLGGAKNFTSRLVSTQILQWTKARPANISSLMETLLEREQLILNDEDERGAHKTYRLSDSGKVEAEKQMQKLEVLEKAA